MPALREFQGLSDAFSLQQVPALMRSQNLQACSDGEMNHWNEGIREADAVDVAVPGAIDELMSLLVAAEKSIENGQLDLGAGPDLLRRSDPFRFGRGLDEASNEPAAEPARRDVLNHDRLTIHERARHRCHVLFVGYAEVLEALANAPHTWSRRPVELPLSERHRERDCALVGGVELGSQTATPWGTRFRNHVLRYNDNARQANTSGVRFGVTLTRPVRSVP
jgi:hypothetical protein